MKKKIIIVLSIVSVLVLSLIALILYLYPKSYSFRVEGIKYQLGIENKDFVKPVTIDLKGTLEKSITGIETFKGTIAIEGESITTANESRELEIDFDTRGGGLMYYFQNEWNPPLLIYGTMFIGKDLSEFTITVWIRDEPNSGSGSWSGGDGFMISAPAHNRDEALAISNRLMKTFLSGSARDLE